MRYLVTKLYHTWWKEYTSTGLYEWSIWWTIWLRCLLIMTIFFIIVLLLLGSIFITYTTMCIMLHILCIIIRKMGGNPLVINMKQYSIFFGLFQVFGTMGTYG